MTEEELKATVSQRLEPYGRGMDEIMEEIAPYTEAYKKLEEENKNLKEKVSEITMVADDEKQSIEHILELEKENEELKKQNDRLTTQIAKQLLKNV